MTKQLKLCCNKLIIYCRILIMYKLYLTKICLVFIKEFTVKFIIYFKK